MGLIKYERLIARNNDEGKSYIDNYISKLSNKDTYKVREYDFIIVLEIWKSEEVI